MTTTGLVTGTSWDGIYAYSHSSTAGNLTTPAIDVNAVDVTGGSTGIWAKNNGTGALNITTSGTVTGKEPLYSNGDNTYYGDGIYARNVGSGALNITALSGTVEGDNHAGIVTYSGGDTTVTVAAQAVVRGGQFGIRSTSNGAGGLSIAASGTVTGTDIDGIFAETGGGSTGDLTIETADTAAVEGGTNGITAKNHGYGAVSITANGTVTGTSGDGIYATNFSDGTSLTITAPM